MTAHGRRNCASHEKVKSIWAPSARQPVSIGGTSDGILTASRELQQNKQQGGAVVRR